MSRVLYLVLLLCHSIAAIGAEPRPIDNNKELTVLFERDQVDHRAYRLGELSAQNTKANDEVRRTRVYEMLRSGKLQTAQDYFYAAVIFHHGQTFEQYRLSASLAWIAHELEPNNTTYAWQTASSWDRMMLKKDRPQWYGVQAHRNEHKQLVLSNIDEAVVTDAERQRYNVKPLDELKNKPGRSPISPLP
jgi:hypothetical protein